MGYDGPNPCNDCGWPTTPMDGPREWYHLHNPVWESMGLPSGTTWGFLCIGCVEARLGRRLGPEDFDGYNPDPRDSQSLRDRKGQ